MPSLEDGDGDGGDPHQQQSGQSGRTVTPARNACQFASYVFSGATSSMSDEHSGSVCPIDRHHQQSCAGMSERPRSPAGAATGGYPSLPLIIDQQATCAGCGSMILDRFLLKVCDTLWHEQCLSCSMCDIRLDQSPSCYVREGKIFCKVDYKRIFGAKCARCLAVLNSSDIVQRTMDGVYHATCFMCFFCGQVLQPGDQFVVNDGQLVCRSDYETIIQNSFPEFKLANNGGGDHRKAPKRPRTILTSQQRKAFKASFEISAKPARKVREALAKETGLSVRVVQVWFQNQRAKMKKIQRKQEQAKQQQSSDIEKDGGSSSSKCAQNYIGAKGSIGSPASSFIDSSSDELDLSRSSMDNEKLLDERCVASSDANPINKLYSMQNTYLF